MTTVKRKILCYGDSNTGGSVPGSRGKERYPRHIRWPGVMAELLGDGYEVVEDGIGGRRTIFDDPTSMCKNGLTGLGYALIGERPMDLVILMLGTNDLHHTDAAGSCEGLSTLLHHILHAEEIYDEVMYPPEGPKVLLVSPILLVDNPIAPLTEEFRREPEKFSALTKELAAQKGVEWLDAAAFAEASHLDGCHLDAENHHRLGIAMAAKVKEIFNTEG